MRSYRKRRNSKRSSVRGRTRRNRQKKNSGRMNRQKKNSGRMNSRRKKKRTHKKTTAPRTLQRGGMVTTLPFVPTSTLFDNLEYHVSEDSRDRFESLTIGVPYETLVPIVYETADTFNKQNEGSPYKIVLKGGRAYQLRQKSISKSVKTGFDIDFIVHFEKNHEATMDQKAEFALDFLKMVKGAIERKGTGPLPEPVAHTNRGPASICQLAFRTSEGYLPFVDVGVGLNEVEETTSYYPPFYEDYYEPISSSIPHLLVQSESSFAMETKHLQRKLQVEAFKTPQFYTLSSSLSSPVTYRSVYTSVYTSLPDGTTYHPFLKLMESLNKFIVRGGRKDTTAWKTTIDNETVEFTLLDDMVRVYENMRLPPGELRTSIFRAENYSEIYAAFNAPPPIGDAPPPIGDAPPPIGDAPPPIGVAINDLKQIKDFKDLYEVLHHLGPDIIAIIDTLRPLEDPSAVKSEIIETLRGKYGGSL